MAAARLVPTLRDAPLRGAPQGEGLCFASLYWLRAFLRVFQLIAALVRAPCGSWRKRSAPPAPAKTYRLPLEITQTVGSASRRTPFDMFMGQDPPHCGAYFSRFAFNRARCSAVAE